MSKRQIQTKAGFTIIEVVLVLAIAGLIFMMVFLALPALQRAQRDTQRSDDIARLQAAINSYQANNRGKIPDDKGYVLVDQTTGVPKGSSEDGGVGSSAKKWADFYNRYILVGKGTAADSFEDPSGGPYALYITDCGVEPGDPEARCSLQPANFDFNDQAGGSNSIFTGVTAGDSFRNVITITTNAMCSGEDVLPSTGARKVAIAYKKEGGGTICLNN